MPLAKERGRNLNKKRQMKTELMKAMEESPRNGWFTLHKNAEEDWGGGALEKAADSYLSVNASEFYGREVTRQGLVLTLDGTGQLSWIRFESIAVPPSGIVAQRLALVGQGQAPVVAFMVLWQARDVEACGLSRMGWSHHSWWGSTLADEFDGQVEAMRAELDAVLPPRLVAALGYNSGNLEIGAQVRSADGHGFVWGDSGRSELLEAGMAWLQAFRSRLVLLPHLDELAEDWETCDLVAFALVEIGMKSTPARPNLMEWKGFVSGGEEVNCDMRKASEWLGRVEGNLEGSLSAFAFMIQTANQTIAFISWAEGKWARHECVLGGQGDPLDWVRVPDESPEYRHDELEDVYHHVALVAQRKLDECGLVGKGWVEDPEAGLVPALGMEGGVE